MAFVHFDGAPERPRKNLAKREIGVLIDTTNKYSQLATLKDYSHRNQVGLGSSLCWDGLITVSSSLSCTIIIPHFREFVNR